MEFRLLGPFEARHDDVLVQLSRRQERCLLAVLLLAPGQWLPTQRIADLLWHDHPSATARGAIHTYVGRLRRRLSAYGLSIATRGDSYLVDPDGHTVDVTQFTSLVRRAGTATVPVDQVQLYDRALRLWRGPLLADVADDELRARLEPELTELRLTAAELRAQAQLTMGLHDRVVTELGPYVEATPTRERLVGSLMTGLYRSGRQADALELYRRTRDLLDDELGLEPGRELAELQGRILRGDPALDRPPMPVFAVQVADQWLPWNTSGHPALEFCNTYAGWSQPPQPSRDWLTGYATLAVWTGHHGLTDQATVARLRGRAEDDPAAAAAVLADARELRAQLYAGLTQPDDSAAFHAVATYAEAAARQTTFRLGEDRLGRWSVSPAAGLRLPVLAVARSAADLLADPRRFTVRACPAPGCGWLFLDETGQRRYCSAAMCDGKAPQ
jgi:SARP family transcriptional regulator, regulator of embCAB operon